MTLGQRINAPRQIRDQDSETKRARDCARPIPRQFRVGCGVGEKLARVVTIQGGIAESEADQNKSRPDDVSRQKTWSFCSTLHGSLYRTGAPESQKRYLARRCRRV